MRSPRWSWRGRKFQSARTGKEFASFRSLGFTLDGEAIMKRERVLRIFLTLLGILFLALLYPLYLDLWHAKWLLVMHNETEPMFLSFFIALGPFLLIAARNPPAHRLLILFTAWSGLSAR
jgi:hypothetical protein